MRKPVWNELSLSKRNLHSTLLCHPELVSGSSQVSMLKTVCTLFPSVPLGQIPSFLGMTDVYTNSYNPSSWTSFRILLVNTVNTKAHLVFFSATWSDPELPRDDVSGSRVWVAIPLNQGSLCSFQLYLIRSRASSGWQVENWVLTL